MHESHRPRWLQAAKETSCLALTGIVQEVEEVIGVGSISFKVGFPQCEVGEA